MMDTKPDYQRMWTLAQLYGRMLSNDWKPLPCVGLWIHTATGYEVNLNAIMLDGREYWLQLAERNQTPPTMEPPF